MVLMFQKELAERIISKENTKKYGRISLLSQAYFNVKKELIVKKAEFTPVPKVDAIVLKFTPLERKKIKVSNIKNLEKLSNFFFNDRRKKNKKKIKSLFSDEQIIKNKYEKYFDLRPENLNKEIFYEMSNQLLD
jgi:16S rRNA (adenine1518-N6/adenine1519-N6)-dimethyltransferase